MESAAKLEPVEIPVMPELSVSGSVATPLWWPSGHRVGLVLGHDLGTDMNQEFLVTLQSELTRQGYLTLRFNFPFAEKGRKRPDAPALLTRTFRSAAAILLRDLQTAPARTFLGGLGLGGRVGAEVLAKGFQADGLICLGFPLHPSGKPSRQRTECLFRISCPMLFIQGSRDPYCRIDRLAQLLQRIGAPTSLHVVEDGTHGLGLIKRSTRTPEEVRGEVMGAIESFVRKTLGGF